jgi:hypothetical protein
LYKVNVKIILPMTKTSTIHFTINNLASESKPEIQDTDSVLNLDEEYGDVLSTLDELSYDVRQAVVDNILNIASKM